MYNPRPVRVSTDPTCLGGGASPPPLGAILDTKTAFDCPGHEVLEYIAKLCLEVSVDVTDQVNGRIFDNPLASPGNAAV